MARRADATHAGTDSWDVRRLEGRGLTQDCCLFREMAALEQCINFKIGPGPVKWTKIEVGSFSFFQSTDRAAPVQLCRRGRSSTMKG